MHVKVLKQGRTWLDVQLEADPSGCHLETEQSQQSGKQTEQRSKVTVCTASKAVRMSPRERAQSGEVRLHRLQPTQLLNQEGLPRGKAWKLRTSSNLSFPICVMEEITVSTSEGDCEDDLGTHTIAGTHRSGFFNLSTCSPFIHLATYPHVHLSFYFLPFFLSFLF